MDAVAFKWFIEHFNKNLAEERPAVLLTNRVSSHINMAAFEMDKSKGKELYRTVQTNSQRNPP
ncbi:hypothetical protein DPMN_007126 [Dreissena polymorpha]|uniref:Uncharacterized protein n=1 Tax=Dreissena polymorpha TaxID=45954 RepID=A0A9D4MT53_DREPO|nr:hypothetical protein DPMN_007126 [Dreissena polymorpha]